MSDIPAENYSLLWAEDTRHPPPLKGDERETLVEFLDWHRETLELKCSGVPADRLSEQNIPPSGLSLHGLVRHLAGVERWWFRLQFAGEDLPQLYYSDDDPDQDFEFHGADFGEDLRVWQSECEASRAIVASAYSVEQTGIRRRDGQPFSLRWLLVNTIAEYGRHNGHADLLREKIDGRTGH